MATQEELAQGRGLGVAKLASQHLAHPQANFINQKSS